MQVRSDKGSKRASATTFDDGEVEASGGCRTLPKRTGEARRQGDDLCENTPHPPPACHQFEIGRAIATHAVARHGAAPSPPPPRERIPEGVTPAPGVAQRRRSAATKRARPPPKRAANGVCEGDGACRAPRTRGNDKLPANGEESSNRRGAVSAQLSAFSTASDYGVIGRGAGPSVLLRLISG